MYSMVTTVNITVLYIWKLLKKYILKVLISRKETILTMCNEGC